MKAFISAIALSLPVAAGADAWSNGVEREVDEGIYMKVFASQSGWRIWRSEGKSGVTCKAVKSSSGRPHPVPAGVQSMLIGGTPFLSIYKSEARDKVGKPLGYDKINYIWRGQHFDKRTVKIRKPGERFWDEYPYWDPSKEVDMKKYEETKIEVYVSSFEYPEISMGEVEETAIFDLSGMQFAIDTLETCEQSKAN
jgi:hypothetical protein